MVGGRRSRSCVVETEALVRAHGGLRHLLHVQRASLSRQALCAEICRLESLDDAAAKVARGEAHIAEPRKAEGKPCCSSDSQPRHFVETQQAG